jgi:hypothetical protein
MVKNIADGSNGQMTVEVNATIQHVKLGKKTSDTTNISIKIYSLCILNRAWA